MNSNLTFTIPLSSAAHQIALEYYKQHDRAPKAKQVYLNTLAVYAVNTYLGYFGIETDLQGSDSQNIVLQMLSDCADIHVKDWGKLECRPVLYDSVNCYIPPEVWGDRKGYIAVQFDRELKEAKLLGFLPEIKESEISCDRWQSLEQLLEKVGESIELSKEKVGEPILSQNIGKVKAKLSHWLQGAIDLGWQNLEELYPSQQLELAFRFRGKVNGSPAKKMSVERGKYLNLQRAEEQIAILVGLAPTTNSEMDISVEIYPANTQSYLPQDLQLMILDEDEGTIMQANARGTDRLQVKFSGEVGDCFNVKLALGDFSLMEFFEI
ncbi:MULTISPECIES: DUF1822 family protein [Spirulina sp. CCY15215]|uniref:DUF1822 family protein n=1 Tax=Spirulina sp. CCY15215 TaxID=2767591 RepID=UPI00194FA636|nr:DUF1822 family protein [Spirulina major]